MLSAAGLQPQHPSTSRSRDQTRHRRRRACAWRAPADRAGACIGAGVNAMTVSKAISFSLGGTRGDRVGGTFVCEITAASTRFGIMDVRCGCAWLSWWPVGCQAKRFEATLRAPAGWERLRIARSKEVYDEHRDYPMALPQLDSTPHMVDVLRNTLQERTLSVGSHFPREAEDAGKCLTATVTCSSRALSCFVFFTWRCGCDRNGTSVGRVEHVLLERLDTCGLYRARGNLRAYQPQARGPEGRFQRLAAQM